MVSERDAVWRRPGPIDEPASGDDTPASRSAGTPAPSQVEAAATANEAAAAPAFEAAGSLAWPGPEAAATGEPGSPVSRSVLMVAAGAVMGAIVALALYSLAVGSSGSGPNQFAFGGGRAPAPFQQGNPGVQRGQAQPPLPGGQNPRGGQVLPQLQDNALPRTPDFVGQVRTISGRSMTVDTAGGSRVVQVTADTRVYLADGSPGSASDLQRGSTVAVVTSTDPATRLLVADAVQLVR
jgi:hypothetical protein